jgi:carboxymethylenebutenolidase
MIQLAELDKRINNTWPAYEKQLKANSTAYTMHMYKGVNHGFHNDSTSRFDKSAADLSWQRTLDFFSQHLQLA